MNEPLNRDIAAKVDRRMPAMGSPEKSDGDIVPRKLANKGASDSAEQVEGREPTQEESSKDHRITQSSTPRLIHPITPPSLGGAVDSRRMRLAFIQGSSGRRA
jgi:hypothetical protein